MPDESNSGYDPFADSDLEDDDSSVSGYDARPELVDAPYPEIESHSPWVKRIAWAAAGVAALVAAVYLASRFGVL